LVYLLLLNNYSLHRASFTPNLATPKALNATMNVPATRTLFITLDQGFTSAQFLVALKAIKKDIVVLIR
jgi:hypothetical protein